MKLRCIICDGTFFRSKVKSKNLKIYECNNCGLYIVPQKKTYKSNVSEYFKDYDLDKYISYYESFRKIIYKNNWKQIKKWKKTGFSLDFGSSFGWFLEVAPKGWSAYGIEPAEVANICKKKGLNVIQGTEEEIGKFRKSFDLITMWNVIEHLPQPIETLRFVSKKMNSKGIYAIAFPNKDGFYNRLAYFLYFLSFGRIVKPLSILFQSDNMVPHLYHYRIKDMQKMLAMVGFEILMIKSQKIIDAKNLWKRQEVQSSMLLKFVAVPLLIVLDTLLDFTNFNNDEVVVYARKLN